VFTVLGAVNDSASAEKEKKREAQKNVTRHNTKPAAYNPVIHAGDSEYQYMRVPKL